MGSAQEVLIRGRDYDGQPTIALPDLILAAPDSNYIYSDVSHPTHVPTSTSPTSLGAYEHHDFDPMDSQYEQTESSLQDLTQIGSGLTVNADPASVLEGTEYLQNWPSMSTASDRIPLAVWGDELEQRRMNAIWSLWGFPDDGPQLSYADTLRQLERNHDLQEHPDLQVSNHKGPEDATVVLNATTDDCLLTRA
ncbi:hypothetical protein DTO027B5_1723 [Paecilomyces variotii]|nr:hypothetical protein DTO027B3_1265 [Paecilomyces variotii]KAJ9336408.1 hypothetical protein DTO027B5_1723 [Paecilomyces variotii]